MGVGIIAIPVFFKMFGIVYATILMVIFACLSIYSAHNLLITYCISNRSGYSTLAKLSYGNPSFILVKIIMIINNLGLVCACFRILGNVIKAIVDINIKDSYSFLNDNWHGWFYILAIGVAMSFVIFTEKFGSLKVSLYVYF